MPRNYIHTKRGKTLNYSPSQLTDAVQACENGMSIRKAAKTFQIPKSTIADRISGRFPVNVTHGRPCAIPHEIESKIVECVKIAAERGIGLSRKQVILRANVLCQRLNIKTSYPNFKAGKNWFEGLKKRHNLVLKKPEPLGSTRARMMNRQVVGKYFDTLGNILSSLGLHDHPQYVWNCDETSKNFEHQPVRVIARRGANVVGKTSSKSSNITIMACVNAAGCAMPPMFVVKGKTFRSVHGFNTDAAPSNATWAFQQNGWMDDELGEQWFNGVFLKHCGAHRPQLLILDGHSSHESLAILERAIEEQIYILALPPHTTHHLQPLDKSVFGPLSRAYNHACSEFLQENPLHLVNKWTFPALINQAWTASFTPSNIASGFSACGIFPYNPSVILDKAYAPSDSTDRPLASVGTSASTSSVSNSGDASDTALLTLPDPDPVLPPPAASPIQLTPSEVLDLLSSGDFVINGDITAPMPEVLTTSASSDLSTFEDVSNETEEVVSVMDSTPSEQANMTPEANWNFDVEAMFLPQTVSQSISTPVSCRKSIKTHRLLTSLEVLQEKRSMELKKQSKRSKVRKDSNKL